MAVVYITSMAIINGARSAETIIRTVKMGLPTVLKVCLLLHPYSLFDLLRFIVLTTSFGCFTFPHKTFHLPS
jgi:energy-converting hydrogenase Eha subunit E